MKQMILKNKGFLISLLIMLVTVSPVLVIITAGFNAEPEIWAHLKAHVLPQLLANTAVLIFGVLALTALIGISLAWLTAFHDFFARKVFEKLLLLPLAVPAYVMAFIYTGLLDFSGPVRSFLRLHLPGLAPYFPEIRSAWGVIMVISFSVYPYVFLMASSGFRSMGASVIEASHSLQAGRLYTFFKVTVPMARPWIFGGLILVFMETLADFGAVSVFNYDTFTTGVYKAWYGFFSINAAAQLASILVIIILVVFLFESYFKKKQQFFNKGHQPVRRTKLRGFKALAAFFYCALIFLAAFMIPLIQLLAWTFASFNIEMNSNYIRLLTNSVLLGSLGMAVTLLTAIVLAYCQRGAGDMKTKLTARMSLSGYALPGTVLAVGMINVVTGLDKALAGFLSNFGISASFDFLNNSLWLLPVCYMIRFLTAGFNPISGNISRLTLSLDEAARLMKVTGLNLFVKIHFPLIRKGLITGGILVFVEIIKEMPVTLMLRPFGWDTLAVKIYELTSEGEWERAALPAVTLVLAGMIPIFLLSIMKRNEN